MSRYMKNQTLMVYHTKLRMVTTTLLDILSKFSLHNMIRLSWSMMTFLGGMLLNMLRQSNMPLLLHSSKILRLRQYPLNVWIVILAIILAQGSLLH